MNRKSTQGQALTEYIIIFAVMAFLGVNLVRGLKGIFQETAGGLGYALTQQLASGTCPQRCYFNNFVNQ